MNASWCWKNICKVKEKMRTAYTRNQWLNTGDKYTIKAGYNWLHQGEKVIWSHWVWNSFNVPKHSFIAWMTAQGKLRTRSKLAAAGICVDTSFALCCQVHF